MRGLQKRCGWLVTLMLLLLAGCDQSAEQVTEAVNDKPDSVIQGSVLYRERMILPENARLKIVLEDVSQADAASMVIAQQFMPLTGTPPYKFELSYDPALISEQRSYAIRAAISADDELMFATTEHYQPFGSENVTIMVRRVATEPLPIPETHASELITGMWGLEALGETTLSASTGDNRPNLNLLPGGDANGFAGCNQFRTQYQVSTEGTEAKLTFSPVAASRKMCEQTMALEGAMLAALNATQKYRLSESTLTLMDGDGKEVARFLRLNE